MPVADPARRWAVSEIKAAAEANVSLEPINHSWRSLGRIRGHDGFVIFESFEDNIAVNMGYIFCSGDVWGIDTALLSACTHDAHHFIALRENDFTLSLTQYSSLLSRLGINGPFSWVAGISNVLGRGIYMPKRQGYSYHQQVHGQCMLENIIVDGICNAEDSPALALKPFFERVYESCGTSRPDWLDNEK